MDEFFRDHGSLIFKAMWFIVGLLGVGLLWYVRRRELRMDEFKDRIWERLDSLDRGQHDLILQNERAHSEIIRQNEIAHIQFRDSITGLEKKLPNGEIEGLRRAINNLIRMSGGRVRMEDEH